MQSLSDKLSPQIRKKALQTARLNHAVKSSLPNDCKDHVQVAGLQDKQLLLLTDSPVWMARLRLLSTTILETINQQLGLSLQRVSIKTRPLQRHIPEPQPRPRFLSRQSAQIIEQMANCIDDPKLSQAMKKLAGRGKRVQK